MHTGRRLTLGLLLALAGASHAAAGEAKRCHYAPVVDLPIRYVGAGLAPAVDATVNKTPATMLLDTGSYTTALTMTGVARRGLPLRATDGAATGISGTTRVYATHVKSFGIGPKQWNRSIDMAVIGETTYTPDYDGLFGAPFLLQWDLMLDLRAKRMKMYLPRDCDDTELYLWDEDTFVVPTQGKVADDPNPRFKVRVNGKELYAEIDSGAGSSFMTLAAARRAGIDVTSPAARSTGAAGGIGRDRATLWTVPIRKFEIGDEVIEGAAEMDVIDVQGGLSADLLLGQDFLRAHRVLFAMSQDKLYIAYLGGEVFKRGKDTEAWIRQEAEAGNPDAQYALALAYGGDGDGGVGDPAQQHAWMDRAAASGQPNAALIVGRRQLLAGQVGPALALLRAALDQLPSDRHGPLWLYLARLRNGEADLGRRELQALLDKQQMDDWPYPIAQYFLGKWDAGRVLAEAAKDKAFAQERTREADIYLAQWRAAQGGTAQAPAPH